MPQTLRLAAAGVACAVTFGASPALAVHCGVLTGDQVCIPGPDPDDIAQAGPFEEGTTNNDSVFGEDTIAQVNQDGLLGNSDWLYGGQFDFDDGMFDTDDQAFDPGLSISGDDMTGTFNTSDDLLDRFDDVMFVLSVADDDVLEGDSDDLNYYGYLLTATMGSYDGPNAFPNDDLDHLSVYATEADAGGGVDPIPVPAALPLFLTGLAGLGVIARRKRRVAA